MRTWARRILFVCAAVAAIVIATPPLMYAYHRKTWHEVEARWEALRRKYPRDEGNESARQLQVLAAPLGLDLGVHRRESEKPAPRPATSDAIGELGRYAAAFEKAPGGHIPEPPAAVTAYLQAHRADLDRLIAHLAQRPAPRWPSDVGEVDARELNGQHLFAIARLLRTEALWQEQRGAHAEAQRALEALWNLGRALSSRPDTIAGIIGDGYASSALRLSTRMDELPSIWQRRFGEIDPHRRLEETLDVLSLDMTVLMHEEAKHEGGWLLEASAWDSAIALRRTAAGLAGRAPCSLDAGTASKVFRRRTGFWNFVGRHITPDLDAAWERADRLLVEAELARKVLDVKARRDAAGGVWPASVPGIESSACTGAHWTYSVAPDGRMTLAFSRGFGDKPPLSFTAAARPLH